MTRRLRASRNRTGSKIGESTPQGFLLVRKWIIIGPKSGRKSPRGHVVTWPDQKQESLYSLSWLSASMIKSMNNLVRTGKASLFQMPSPTSNTMSSLYRANSTMFGQGLGPWCPQKKSDFPIAIVWKAWLCLGFGSVGLDCLRKVGWGGEAKARRSKCTARLLAA